MGYDDISTQQILSEMSVDKTTEPQAEPEQTQAAPEVQLYEYSANGKTIKEPLDVILKRASQGYNYAQNQEQVNKEKSRWAEIEKVNQELSQWKQYDEYAKQNPQWAEHVKSSWEKRQTLSDPDLDPSDPLVGKLSALEQMLNTKLTGLESKFQTYDSWIASQTQSREDEAFSTEIQSIRQAHPDIDFSASNAEGKSLEMQILEHMRDNQIPSFRAGFRDFYHEKLIENAKLKAKDSVASSVQKNAKKGVVSTSSSMHPSNASTPHFAKMSYDQLAELAKQDLRT
jgi:hypothetical protein